MSSAVVSSDTSSTELRSLKHHLQVKTALAGHLSRDSVKGFHTSTEVNSSIAQHSAR
jgi:hypothetical protein